MSQTRRPGTSGSAAGGVTPGLAFSSTVNPSIETTVGLVDPPRSVEGERLVQTLRLDALGHAATDYYPNLQDLSITRPGTSSSPALSATARSTGAIGAGFSSVDPLGTRRSRPASIGQLIGANLKRPATQKIQVPHKPAPPPLTTIQAAAEAAAHPAVSLYKPRAPPLSFEAMSPFQSTSAAPSAARPHTARQGPSSSSASTSSSPSTYIPGVPVSTSSAATSALSSSLPQQASAQAKAAGIGMWSLPRRQINHIADTVWGLTEENQSLQVELDVLRRRAVRSAELEDEGANSIRELSLVHLSRSKAELTSIAETLLARLAEMERVAAGHASRNERLRELVAERERAVEEWRALHISSVEETKRKDHANERLKQHVEELKLEINPLKLNVAKLQEAIERKEATVQAVTEERDRTVLHLKDQLLASTAKSRSTEEELARATSQLQLLRGATSAAADAHHNAMQLKAQLEANKRQDDVFVQQRMSLETANLRLAQDKEELRRLVLSLKEELFKMEEAYRTLEAKLADADAQRVRASNEAQLASAAANKMRETLEREVESLKASLSQMQSGKSSAVASETALRAEFAEYRAKVRMQEAESKALIDVLRNDIKQVTLKMQVTKAAEAHAAKERAEQQSKDLAVEMRIGDLDAEVSALKQQLAQVQASLAEARNETAQVRRQAAKDESGLSELRNEFFKSQAVVEERSKEVKELRNKLSAQEKEFAGTKRQLTQAMAQNILDNKELAHLRPIGVLYETVQRKADNLELLLKAEMEKTALANQRNRELVDERLSLKEEISQFKVRYQAQLQIRDELQMKIKDYCQRLGITPQGTEFDEEASLTAPGISSPRLPASSVLAGAAANGLSLQTGTEQRPSGSGSGGLSLNASAGQLGSQSPTSLTPLPTPTPGVSPGPVSSNSSNNGDAQSSYAPSVSSSSSVTGPGLPTRLSVDPSSFLTGSGGNGGSAGSTTSSSSSSMLSASGFSAGPSVPLSTTSRGAAGGLASTRPNSSLAASASASASASAAAAGGFAPNVASPAMGRHTLASRQGVAGAPATPLSSTSSLSSRTARGQSRFFAPDEANSGRPGSALANPSSSSSSSSSVSASSFSAGGSILSPENQGGFASSASTPSSTPMASSGAPWPAQGGVRRGMKPPQTPSYGGGGG